MHDYFIKKGAQPTLKGIISVLICQDVKYLFKLSINTGFLFLLLWF